MIENLNNRQREAVLGTEGPMLVLAGAGSGKTKVLTTKIAYLIKEKKVFCQEILAITFTNKAAQEMRERVAKLLDMPVDTMWIGTFHSIAVRMLRRTAEKIGYTNNFSIYDRDDQKTLLKEVYKELGISDKSISYNAVLSKISMAKNQGVMPENFMAYYGKDPTNLAIGQIYQSYEDKKFSYNSMDFDDLIVKALDLLKKDQETRDYYQEKFKYIFVDEYQDTNQAQYEMVKIMSGKYKNICVVGDSDQSIYGWRGADISNILNFEKDFPGSKLVLLEENYRSTKGILDAANKVIKNNSQRKDKNLWTSKTGGQKPVYKEVSSENGEARIIVEKIDHLLYKGEKLNQMAILYRTNAQSRQLEEALVYAQIPYTVVGGLKFYDRKEIKDILAYLRVIVNPSDDISYKRIINEPKRGLGDASIEKIERAAKDRSLGLGEYTLSFGGDLDLSGKALQGLMEFRNILEEAKKTIQTQESLAVSVQKIIDLTGIIDQIRKEDTIEAKSRLENIESFINSVSEFETSSLEYGEKASLDDYLASVSLMSDVDKTDSEKSGIKLMTIHSAKGLEFKTVFLTGLEDGLFPSKFSIDEGNLEEERRLFYVAITRAEENLYISSSKLRRVFGNLMPAVRSRFIEELEDTIEEEMEEFSTSVKREVASYKETDRNWDTSYLKFGLDKRRENLKKSELQDFRIGDKLRHKKFGLGTVISANKLDSGAYDLMISFENKGVKKFRSDLAPLEKED